MAFGKKYGPRPRRPEFIGTPDQYRDLAIAWGLAAVERMKRGDDSARFDAELAVKFARRGGWLDESGL